jgi:hypothetical protein
LTETHPPTPSDLITGIDRVEGMLSDTISLRTRQTPSQDLIFIQHAFSLAQHSSRSIPLREVQDPDQI